MYQPLTPDQFNSAQKAGFSTDQIIAHEKTRQQQESQLQPLTDKQIWSNPKTYGGIAQGVSDTFAGSGAETLKRATQVPQGAKLGTWQDIGKNLVNPKTYTGALKDTGTFIHGLGQAARTDVGFIPKGIFNLGKDVVTGNFGKQIDQAQYDPVLGQTDNSTFGKIKGAANAFNTGLASTAPLLGAVDLVDSLPKNTNDVPGLKQINKSLESRYVNQNIKDWSEPIKTNKPGFNKATDIFENAKGSTANPHNIAETLTNNKLQVSDHIENGAYSTADTADQLRADAGKLSSETLRPSLQRADTYTPKTAVAKVMDAARNDIATDFSITPGNKATLFKKLDAEQFALQKQYPDGLSLENLHDNKITYDANAKYSPVGDIATNNAATLNKAVADSMRSTLEKTAPKDIPVQDFSKELQKQYQAANYLDAIDGKKVPQSIMSRIAKTASKVTGAAVGNTLGGGVLGSVGGYHIGGMVESLFENLPNPVKSRIMNNLQVTNPAVFEQVKGFVNAPQPNFPQLEAPKTIFAGPRTSAEPKIEVLPAEKQIYRDPTSGQMQRGYKSTPDITKNPQAGFADFGQMGKDIKSMFTKDPTIHPEDQQLMKNFIDEVRLNKKPSLQLQLDASRIAEHYGLPMPKTLPGLANTFDKYLTKFKAKYGAKYKGSF